MTLPRRALAWTSTLAALVAASEGCASTNALTETRKLDQSLAAHGSLAVHVEQRSKADLEALQRMLVDGARQRKLFPQVAPADEPKGEGLVLSLRLVAFKDENPYARKMGGDSEIEATVAGRLVHGDKVLAEFSVKGSSKSNTRVSVGGYQVTKGTRRDRALRSVAETVLDYLESHRGE
jgi:hypothetical protein